ncbi:MAG: 4Fe-4S dicluster domain-containing protein, partial [Acidimicrobiaceae bacterium]|nr:4Fe-4S dicluster domain-containing protein [Acidimicrobiaceae bacterium]
MTRWGMVIDAARCVGCQACTVACKTENQSPLDAWYAPVIEWEEGEFPDATLNYLPVLCNHCEDAPCVTACPSGALTRRDDGIVMADEDVCIGSRACMTACPYGALHFFEDRGTVAVEGAPAEAVPSVPERYAHQRHV